MVKISTSSISYDKCNLTYTYSLFLSHTTHRIIAWYHSRSLPVQIQKKKKKEKGKLPWKLSGYPSDLFLRGEQRRFENAFQIVKALSTVYFGMVFITDNLEKASIIPLPPTDDFLCSCVFHMEAPGKRYCRGGLDPSFLRRYPLHTDMSEQILLILQFRERPCTGPIWVDPKSREALIILEVGVFLTSHSVDIASKAHWRDLRGLCISLFF